MNELDENDDDGGAANEKGQTNHHHHHPNSAGDNISIASNYSSSMVQTDPPEDNTIMLSPETHTLTTTSTMPYGELSW